MNYWVKQKRVLWGRETEIMAIAILCIYSQWKNYTAFSISSNQQKVHSEWSVVSILSNHRTSTWWNKTNSVCVDWAPSNGNDGNFRPKDEEWGGNIIKKKKREQTVQITSSLMVLVQQPVASLSCQLQHNRTQDILQIQTGINLQERWEGTDLNYVILTRT